MDELKPVVPQGWQCPICGRVYSPTTMFCLCCARNEIMEVTSETYIVPEDMRGEKKKE